MSAATTSVWRLGRARPRQATSPRPRRVLISAHPAPHTGEATIERVNFRDGRIEVLLRLEDGERATATLFDDGVNSLELRSRGRVFVRPPTPHA